MRVSSWKELMAGQRWRRVKTIGVVVVVVVVVVVKILLTKQRQSLSANHRLENAKNH